MSKCTGFVLRNILYLWLDLQKKKASNKRAAILEFDIKMPNLGFGGFEQFWKIHLLIWVLLWIWKLRNQTTSTVWYEMGWLKSRNWALLSWYLWGNYFFLTWVSYKRPLATGEENSRYLNGGGWQKFGLLAHLSINQALLDFLKDFLVGFFCLFLWFVVVLDSVSSLVDKLQGIEMFSLGKKATLNILWRLGSKVFSLRMRRLKIWK